MSNGLLVISCNLCETFSACFYKVLYYLVCIRPRLREPDVNNKYAEKCLSYLHFHKANIADISSSFAIDELWNLIQQLHPKPRIFLSTKANVSIKNNFLNMKLSHDYNLNKS